MVLWKNTIPDNRILLPQAQTLTFIGAMPLMTIGSSHQLSALSPFPSQRMFIGIVHRIRVLETKKGSKHVPCHTYVGVTHSLEFDPAQWSWVDGNAFIRYSTSLGRSLLTKNRQLTRSIPSKWIHHLSLTFSPN